MPVSTTKRHLTRREMLENLARAKQMIANGVDTRIREEWLDAARPLQLSVEGFPESFIFDLPDGRAGYVIGLRMAPRWRVSLLGGCRIMTPSDDEIELDGALLYPKERNSMYRLGQLLYPSRQVLNSRIENGLKFQGFGQMVEGLVLASSMKAIPDFLGTSSPVTIKLLDQNENEISHGFELFVDRSWKREKPPLIPRSNLYETSVIRQQDYCPNINRGRVRDPSCDRPPQRLDGREGPESEADFMLREAIRKLSSR
jgi:hypothetical protein